MKCRGLPFLYHSFGSRTLTSDKAYFSLILETCGSFLAIFEKVVPYFSICIVVPTNIYSTCIQGLICIRNFKVTTPSQNYTTNCHMINSLQAKVSGVRNYKKAKQKQAKNNKQANNVKKVIIYDEIMSSDLHNELICLESMSCEIYVLVNDFHFCNFNSLAASLL